MEEIIKSFTNEKFGDVRIVYESGKPLFCGLDIAKDLGYKNTNDAVLRHCKGVVKRDALTSKGKQEIAFISEGDVYRLITHSKLPDAERFESWIFDDVVPTVRKTGGYVSNGELFLNTYLPFADETTKLLFKSTLEVVRKQNEIIEQQKPMVGFYHQVGDAGNDFTFERVVKILKLNCGRNIFMRRLRDAKILMNGNIPYERYKKQGYLKVILSNVIKGSQIESVPVPLVTPKGLQWLQKLIIEHKIPNTECTLELVS